MTAAVLPGDWSRLVVIRAGSRWAGVKLTDRHIAECLAAHLPVLYVDPPISRLTARRRPELVASGRPRLRLVAPRVAHLAPVLLPGLRRDGVRAANAALLRRQVARAAADLGGDVLALVDTDALLPCAGAPGERRSIFWAHDDFAAGAGLMGLPAGRLRVAQERATRRADLVVAASPVLLEDLRTRNPRTVLIPNGCDPAVARPDARPPADVDLPRPVAGLVGHLNERIDLALLEAVAARGHSLLLVGPGKAGGDRGRFDALVRRRNVRWVGQQPSEALPDYLAAIDVGLVPYADTGFNRGSFPIKTLEYLAAGLACVSTGLPATRWLDTPLITVADGPAAYADAVGALLAAPRTPADVLARQAFAAGHTWARRAADLAGVLVDGYPGEVRA